MLIPRTGGVDRRPSTGAVAAASEAWIAAGRRARCDGARAPSPQTVAPSQTEASDERDECEDAQDAEPRQERQHPDASGGDEPPAERERADGVAEPIQEPRPADTESDRDPDEERHGDDRSDGHPDQHQEAELRSTRRGAARPSMPLASAALGANSTSTRPEEATDGSWRSTTGTGRSLRTGRR
jgi:hypothetical protein